MMDRFSVPEVTQLDSVLRHFDHDVAGRFTEVFGQRVDLQLGHMPTRVERVADGIKITCSTGETVVDELLVATGREPNSDLLDGDFDHPVELVGQRRGHLALLHLLRKIVVRQPVHHSLEVVADRFEVGDMVFTVASAQCDDGINQVYGTVIPERLIGFGRRQRGLAKDVVIAVDQSGSMEQGGAIELAKQAYPAEAQGYHISGIAKLRLKKYDAAYDDFSIYERRMPGDPNTLFFKGLSLEGMQKIDPAARAYHAYLKQVQQGKQAQYAYNRLKEWGYIK